MGALFIVHLVALFVSGLFQRKAAMTATMKMPLDMAQSGVYEAGKEAIVWSFCHKVVYKFGNLA